MILGLLAIVSVRVDKSNAFPRTVAALSGVSGEAVVFCWIEGKDCSVKHSSCMPSGDI